MTIGEIKSAIKVEPYFSEPAGALYCGTCLDIMRDIPDKSVDLVLTDPPYLYDDYSKGNDGFDESDENINFIKSISNSFDIELTLQEFQRVLKKMNIFIFCSKLQIPDCMNWGIKRNYQVNLLVWKKGGRPFGITYNHDLEFIVHIKETGASFNGMYKSRLFEFNSVRNFGHPTEKPISLINLLVSYGSNEDDLILDCFAGSGTTAVACKELGRKYIGIEISPEYCKIAKKRLAQEVFNF